MFDIGTAWQDSNTQYNSNNKSDQEWQSSNTPYNPYNKYDQGWQRSNIQYDKERQDPTGEAHFKFLPHGNILQESSYEDIFSSKTSEEMEEAKKARKILNTYITNGQINYGDDSLSECINRIQRINPVESEYYRKKIGNSE